MPHTGSKKRSHKMSKKTSILFVPSTSPRVTAAQIRLKQGKGSLKSGGGPGGIYWHIYAEKKRVGRVFINMNENEALGRHPSITIEVNASERGQGIGTAAYRNACILSGYDEIYATIRKSNMASIISATRAGFRLAELPGLRETIYVWRKNEASETQKY